MGMFMMRWFLAAFSVCLSFPVMADLFNLSDPALAATGKTGVLAHAHYMEGADYIAAQQFSEQWDGDFSPRDTDNLALLNSRVELGASYQNWRAAALYRKEIYIKSNKQSTELVYFNHQRIDVPIGNQYQIDLAMRGYELNGVRVDYGQKHSVAPNAQFSWGVGLSILQGMAMREAKIKGQASATNTGYIFDLDMADTYSEGEYPFMNIGKSSAQGFAVDLASHLTLNNGLLLKLIANDVLGKLYWENLPHSQARASSDVASKDEQGYISYNPMLSGQNDLDGRSLAQSLLPKVHLSAEYPMQNWRMSIADNWVWGNHFPELGVAYQVNETSKVALTHDIRFGTFGMSAELPWFYLTYRAENYDLSKSNSHQLSLGVHFLF